MVHKKSTYRLMFKNYGADVRREVWQQNNSLRVQRREEEMSHHSIQGDDSECECDLSEGSSVDQAHSRRMNRMEIKGVLNKSQGQGNRASNVESEARAESTHIPRLHFSPEHTPRTMQQQQTSDESANSAIDTEVQNDYSIQNGNQKQISPAQIEDVPQSKRNVKSSKDQYECIHLGPREYDLLPASATTGELRMRPKSAPSMKAGLPRSRKFPLTTQLSRTTKKNFLDRNKIAFVPSGTGCSVRRIGDQTSYNIHLNKDQVKQTALLASSLRNKEIEQLMRKQQKMSLDDWREKNNITEPVNHSSLFADGSKNIFKSRHKPRERLINVPSRVEVFSNFCKHCGGRK